MNVSTLQTKLAARGNDPGPIDGQYGARTRNALLAALTDGSDARVTEANVAHAAKLLNVTPAHIWAIYDVESSGSAFIDGRPTILFEPHRFSRATRHRFDITNPNVSYSRWDAKRYPRTQAARYGQLLEAVGLDVDAGFASASYGGFQVLGENYAACGYATPYDFAIGQSISEGEQLNAAIRFIGQRGLAPALRRKDWAVFAQGYNGTGFRANRYDEKLAAAYAKRGGK